MSALENAVVPLDPKVNTAYVSLALERCFNKPYCNLFGVTPDGHKIPIAVLDRAALLALGDHGPALAGKRRW